MWQNFKRAIDLIENSKSNIRKSGQIPRLDLYFTFTEQLGGSDSMFNSILMLLKSREILSVFSNGGYFFDEKKFIAFKKKYAELIEK